MVGGVECEFPDGENLGGGGELHKRRHSMEILISIYLTSHCICWYFN